MSDAADRAQEQLERAQAAFEQQRPAPAVSAMICADCGEAIEEARRAAVPGCSRCACCQVEYEREVRR